MNLKYKDRTFHTLISGTDAFNKLESLFLEDLKLDNSQLFILNDLEQFNSLKNKVKNNNVLFIENFSPNKTSVIINKILNNTSKIVLFIPEKYIEDFLESIDFVIFDNDNNEIKPFFIYIDSLNELDVNTYINFILRGRGKISFQTSIENKENISNMLRDNMRNGIID